MRLHVARSLCRMLVEHLAALCLCMVMFKLWYNVCLNRMQITWAMCYDFVYHIQVKHKSTQACMMHVQAVIVVLFVLHYYNVHVNWRSLC